MIERGNDGMEPKPAHGNIERCERAKDANIVLEERDFLAGFAHRGRFDGFAGFHGAARERDLTAVAHPIGANRQDDVRLLVDREQEQEARGGPDEGWVESGGPAATGPRSHRRLRVRAGQRAPEGAF